MHRTVHGSGGGIRTHDTLVTPYLSIPTKGGLYLHHIFTDLGAPVSSLYGARALNALSARFPRYYPF